MLTPLPLSVFPSGPYQVNGVPLRRVNQAYVIATSTKVDVSGVKLTGIDDAYFARDASGASAEEEEFFNNSAPQPAIVSDKRKADQKAVDTPLMAALQKVRGKLKLPMARPLLCACAEIVSIASPKPQDKMLKAYLNAKFSLKKGDRPHEMKF
jgi:large subunit ribosomal protein L6e